MAFEDIAREQGAPIDEILSEAMRSYARQRSYGTAEAGSVGQEPRGHDYDVENAPDLARTGARPSGPLQRPPSRAPAPPPRGYPPPPPPMVPSGGPPTQRPYTQPFAPPSAPPPRGRPMPGPPPSIRPPLPQSRSAPPPLPPSDPLLPSAPPFASARARVTSLTLTYNGRHAEVVKDRFILGRSKTQADLVLEDPNVSRQHAAIERAGNEWVLADLGSTNGCYIDGQRVSRRALMDGDVIEITTHQVRCTVR